MRYKGKGSTHYDVCMGVADFFAGLMAVVSGLCLIVLFYDLITNQPVTYNFWETFGIFLFGFIAGVLLLRESWKEK